MFKYIITGLAIFFALLAFLMFSCKLPFGCANTTSNKVTGNVTMWGTLPLEEVGEITNQLGIDVKTYSIEYKEVPEEHFEENLVNALANGEGPDMILTDYKTILSQAKRIAPFPYASFPVNDFKNTYIEGASIFLAKDGVLAFPVAVEPMMMFVNRDILSQNGIVSAPLYWDDLLATVPKLSKRDASGKLIAYGAGLGTLYNVVHGKEVIISLIESLGQEPVTVDVNGSLHFSGNVPLSETSVVLPLRESLKLFTQFSDPSKVTYSWNAYTGMTDRDAFTSGRLAFYFGYSGEALDMTLKNSRLNFFMSPFPLARGYDAKANSMRMYGVAVMKRTPASLMQTAFTAQTTLASSKYSSNLAGRAGKLSPIKAVISADQNLDSGLKSSILVTKGWLDTRPADFARLLSNAVDDIITGKFGVSQSTENFVSAINDLYAK
jgi:ABC-type glycerol-3-phosphate transport system substrate-binding protein